MQGHQGDMESHSSFLKNTVSKKDTQITITILKDALHHMSSGKSK